MYNRLRTKVLIGFGLLFCAPFVMGQDGVPYRIYNSKAKAVNFSKMSRDLKKADVVLFGEFRDNSLGHWLELEVLKNLHGQKNLVLGAEMFERDNQLDLTRYLKGEITEQEMSSLVRLWPNYKTDYRPLVEFAKTHQLEFIATNVPRRYASMLYKQGMESLDSLSLEEKAWMAPLPFDYDPQLQGYKKMLTMFDSDHANENLPKAQAIKDATMAYSIVEHVSKGDLFLHFNGAYHSNFYEGIFWYLNRYQPDLRVITITMVVQDDVSVLEKEYLGSADFIFVIDRNIIKTF